MSHLTNSENPVIQDTSIPPEIDPYLQLTEELSPLRNALINHPVYEQLNDVLAVRIFMESHIFAVWDFMSLIKTLQRRLTCIDVPWLPPKDILSARMVNEIVLLEETDEPIPGEYISHFDLYLAAMAEIGANTNPIRSFILSLEQGCSVEQAIAPLLIPESTKEFVLYTLQTTTLSNHEIAAAFLLGREDIIPAMFRRIITYFESSNALSCNSLRLYLERHTFLDEDQHIPMGKKLLKNLCGRDPLMWKQAINSAHSALNARYSLWSGVSQLIQATSIK
ncbi:conserved hypothetical protein [Planktothrix serta PCC 8927]|uniref:DUF3050 domain-containing protein n=1 Tax=Planktothrix serta PCC 8927 TaxID=671068 RepID=A0A7Z9BRN9_9CYAN|nr:DUF3050 domain-containing protein [Planktothrix serta]VXD19416.1 conserved hypothetical protein [Planktothrix serta PCC 8927]